jgi:hypothetical protein
MTTEAPAAVEGPSSSGGGAGVLNDPADLLCLL